MPEITCLQVAATGVKKGDFVDDVQEPAIMVKGGKTVYENGHMVEAIKRGTSNITFETTGGKIIVAEVAQVNVRREVPTEAEKEAARLERIEVCRASLVEDMDRFVAKAKESREAAAAALSTEYVARSSDLETYLVANARWELAARVEDIMSKARSEQGLHRHEAGVECEYTVEADNGRGMKCVKPTIPSTAWDGVVAVFDTVIKMVQHDAVNRRVLSRSTSVCSNLMEDVKAEANANFITDHLRFNAYGADLPEHITKMAR